MLSVYDRLKEILDKIHHRIGDRHGHMQHKAGKRGQRNADQIRRNGIDDQAIFRIAAGTERTHHEHQRDIAQSAETVSMHSGLWTFTRRMAGGSEKTQ